MKQIPLEAQERQGSGKEAAAKLRQAGFVPAVLYRGGQEAMKLSVPVAGMEKVLRSVAGPTAFVSLDFEGGSSRDAVLKELQRDPMGRKFLHADFYEVEAGQTIEVEVALVLTGHPKGVEDGGQLIPGTHSVVLSGTLRTLPSSLEVDVSGLGLHESLHAGALVLPEGTSLVSDSEQNVASCATPHAGGDAAAEGGEEEGAED